MNIHFRKSYIAVLLAVVMTAGSVYATSIEEIQQQQEETRSKKQEAETLLSDLQSQQSDILESAEEIDAKIQEFQLKLNQITEQRDETQKSIDNTRVQLEEAKEKEAAQYELLKQHIQNAYENSTYTYLDAFMSAVNFADVMNNAEYVEQVNNYDTAVLNDLIDTRTLIANKEAMLNASIEALDELEAEYADEEEALQILYDGKQVQIDNYNESIEKTEELIERLNQEELAQEAQIAALEAAARDAALGGITGPTEYTGGAFSWPMPTSTYITSPFGPRRSPTAGASSNHKGVDIACPTGSNVIAAAGGVVIYVGYMSSAGNAVIIDHGSGITTCYYHLSMPLVEPGQTVSQAQIIALSGSSGVTTGPHLHFCIRINGVYVDPMSYY